MKTRQCFYFVPFCPGNLVADFFWGVFNQWQRRRSVAAFADSPRVTAVKGAGKGREIEVEVRLDSECPSWQKAAEEIASLKPFQELFSLPHEGRLYRVATRYVRHPACGSGRDLKGPGGGGRAGSAEGRHDKSYC